jgi:hypothetical protein
VARRKRRSDGRGMRRPTSRALITACAVLLVVSGIALGASLVKLPSPSPTDHALVRLSSPSGPLPSKISRGAVRRVKVKPSATHRSVVYHPPPSKQEEEAAAKKHQEEEAAAKKHQEEEAAAKKHQEEQAAAKKHEEEARAKIASSLSGQLGPRGKTAKIGALLRHGSYSFSFSAPGAGTLVISWFMVPKGGHLSASHQPVLVATGRASFSKAGALKITVKLTAKGKQLLKHAKRIKLTAKGSFTPTGKAAVVALKTFTVKR